MTEDSASQWERAESGVGSDIREIRNELRAGFTAIQSQMKEQQAAHTELCGQIKELQIHTNRMIATVESHPKGHVLQRIENIEQALIYSKQDRRAIRRMAVRGLKSLKRNLEAYKADEAAKDAAIAKDRQQRIDQNAKERKRILYGLIVSGIGALGSIGYWLLDKFSAHIFGNKP